MAMVLTVHIAYDTPCRFLSIFACQLTEEVRLLVEFVFDDR